MTLLSLWIAGVGAMRDPLILGITEFDLPWPVIPLAAWGSALAVTAWRRRRAEPAAGQLSASSLRVSPQACWSPRG